MHLQLRRPASFNIVHHTFDRRIVEDRGDGQLMPPCDAVKETTSSGPPGALLDHCSVMSIDAKPCTALSPAQEFAQPPLAVLSGLEVRFSPAVILQPQRLQSRSQIERTVEQDSIVPVARSGSSCP